MSSGVLRLGAQGCLQNACWKGEFGCPAAREATFTAVDSPGWRWHRLGLLGVQKPFGSRLSGHFSSLQLSYLSIVTYLSLWATPVSGPVRRSVSPIRKICCKETFA